VLVVLRLRLGKPIQIREKRNFSEATEGKQPSGYAKVDCFHQILLSTVPKNMKLQYLTYFFIVLSYENCIHSGCGSILGVG